MSHLNETAVVDFCIQPLAIYVAFVASAASIGVTSTGILYMALHCICFYIMPSALMLLAGALIFNTEEAMERLNIRDSKNLLLAAGCLAMMFAVGIVIAARTGCLKTQGAYCAALTYATTLFCARAESLAPSDRFALSLFAGSMAFLSMAKFVSPLLIARYGVGSAGKPNLPF